MTDQLNLFKHGLYNFRHRLYNKLAYKKKTGKIIPGICYVTDIIDNIERHHICYDPEVTVWLNKLIHIELHNKLKKYKESGYIINQELQESILDNMKMAMNN